MRILSSALSTSIFIGLLAFASPGAIASGSKMHMIFNEAAIVRYLEEADPLVGYLTGLKMMKAHLAASVMNLNAGQSADALAHVEHPMSEIWSGIEKHLKPEHAGKLKESLLAAVEAAKTNDKTAILARIDAAESLIDEFEREALAKIGNQMILADVVGVLLRTAVVEYNEAFDGKVIKNLVEYHDGAMFVRQAQQTLSQIGPALQARNPKVYDELNQNLAKLYAAWPETGTPPRVMTVTRMQTLVTMAELKLAALRK